MSRYLITNLRTLAETWVEAASVTEALIVHENRTRPRCEVEGVSAVPIPPVRVIVDISGGVFQGAEATVPTEVLVVDCTDARGIFCAFVCDRCEAEKRSRYRADIFINGAYWADEPIEED